VSRRATLTARGAVAHGALVPLDTVKIRMQTAPQGTYKNFVDAGVQVKAPPATAWQQASPVRCPGGPGGPG